MFEIFDKFERAQWLFKMQIIFKYSLYNPLKSFLPASASEVMEQWFAAPFKFFFFGIYTALHIGSLF